MKATTIRAAGLGLVILTLVALVVWVGRPVGKPPPVDALRSDASSSESASTPTALEPTLHGRGEGLTSGEGWEVLVTVLEGKERTPVADAEVRVALYTEGQRDQEVERRTRTDGEGLARIDLTDTGLSHKRLLIRVGTERNMWGGLGYPATPVDGKDRVLAVRIVLGIWEVARGIVVPPPGVPLSAVRMWETGPVRVLIRLEADGSFELSGLEAQETVTVQAAAHHDGVRYTGLGRVVEGRDAFSLTWTEVRPGDRVLLLVRLRDGSGRPVTATLHLGTEAEYDTWWHTVWDAEGEALIDVAFDPGTPLHLAAEPSAPEGLGHVSLPSISPSASTVDLVFREERVIAGRVVRRGGGPGANLDVMLVWKQPCRHGLVRGSHLATVKTDVDGRFTMGGLGPYEYWLVVGGPDKRALAEVVVRADENEFDVVIEPTVDVTLRVVDADGAAVVGAGVDLSLPPPGTVLDPECEPIATGLVRFRSVASGTTDALGRVVLPSVDALLLHRLAIGVPEGRDDLLPLEIEGWEPKDYVVCLERGFFIEGRVEDTEGKIVAGCHVSARCPALRDEGADVSRYGLEGGITRRVWPSARTDETGAFRLGPLRAGVWRLSVVGVRAPSVEAEVGAEGLVLTIPVADVREFIDVRLRVLDLGPEDRGTMAFLGIRGVRLDADGGGRFRHVREGTAHDLWIAPLSGSRYVWERDIEAATEEIVVRPKRGESIRGRVRVPEGVALDSLSLWPFGCQGDLSLKDARAGCFRWTADAETGTFEVTGVPPGSWYIAVWGDQGERRYEGEVNASPGDEVIVDLE